MKKTQVIKIIPVKRKPGLYENKKIYFNKLAKNEILALLTFFNEDEQLKLFTLNNKFKSAYFNINSIDEKDPINEFKYMNSLNKLKNESKGFCPYLNVLLNMNIINLNPEYLGVKLDENKKNNRLKLFLEQYFKENHLNKILIQISNVNDFNSYYNLLSLINPEIREKFKYYIDISSNIDIKVNIDIILKLFNLITFQNIKPFNEKKKTKFIEIQNYYIENNIKTIHKYIWTQNKEKLDNAKNYFTINKNCLLGINNIHCLPLCENNKESINAINIPNFAISEFNYPEIRLKKIYFSYPSEEFNSILLNKINFDNLEQISGLVISRNNINEYIQKINKLKNLRKILRIEFGTEDEDEDEDEIKNELFQNFFNGIKNKHSQNLVEITTWFYVFKKGKDYEFILNNFPNMRKIQEDYDASGLYDRRIEIPKIFSCNAERAFKDNDLCAITKMIKNYIKQKKEGDNSIKFDLYNDYERLKQLIEYWNKNNEKLILEKIDYINFVVEAELNDNELIQLNTINYVNENNCLILNLLNNIKNINQVKFKNRALINSFLSNKNITSIVLDDITNDEYENLLKNKTVKYLILEDNIIKSKEQLLKKAHKFKIIPKRFYIESY